MLFNKDQFEAACGGVSPRTALTYLRDQGVLKREGDKMTMRFNMQMLGIKRLPFYALHIKRLLSDSDLLLVRDDDLEAADDYEPAPETPFDEEPRAPGYFEYEDGQGDPDGDEVYGLGGEAQF